MKRPVQPSEGRSYLTSLIGLPPSGRAEWTAALEPVSDKTEAAALRRRGRALALLGRDAEALAALDDAVSRDGASCEGWAWRGEAHLLAGRRAAARRDLNKSVALSKGWPWARLLLAVCRLTEGDTDGARRDLAAIRSLPEAALVLALLEGQRGEAQKGVDTATRELAVRPTGSLFAVRALLRQGLGDLPGTLADLNRAVALEPAAWIFIKRADVLNRSGFYRPALEDSFAAAALLPDSPEPRLQAANIYFDQAFYPEALEQIERALALQPDDAGLLSRRARFHLLLGRFEEAERGLDRACAREPDSGQLNFERLNVITLRGRYAEVLRDLRSGALPAPFNAYLTGYVLCRKGDRAGAVKHFLRAARQADGGFAERCRFYALVCRVLSKPVRKVGVRPQFYLCGVGIHHPYQVTVEILRALDACEVLYNNLGDPQVSEFLGLFRGEVRAVTRVDNEPAMGRVKRILAGLKRGKTSGFVTRIHPFIYRRIANDLVTACEERKITYEAFGAVSLTEVAWGLSATEKNHGAARGPFASRVFDLSYLLKNPRFLQPAYPTIVYAIANDEDRKGFCALLRLKYSRDHIVFLLAGSGDREQQVVSAPVKDAEKMLLSLDLGTVMYLPPHR